MTGNEFVRKIRQLGRARGVEVRIVKNRGKGGHQTLWYGERHTIVSHHGSGHELPDGTLRAMLRQLGLTPRDLEK